jgi:hypothetical protein
LIPVEILKSIKLKPLLPYTTIPSPLPKKTSNDTLLRKTTTLHCFFINTGFCQTLTFGGADPDEEKQYLQ